ncbi:hypothetical protein GOBAR_DD08209 [Gossypium barbadense]|nr:hypothetical protein GOBAR_DD08209 [Gossypium barbadense]
MDLAVREYKKAKSIALPSHVSNNARNCNVKDVSMVKILKRVIEDYEKVMQEFKGTLYKSMKDPQIDLTSTQSSINKILVPLKTSYYKRTTEEILWVMPQAMLTALGFA